MCPWFGVFLLNYILRGIGKANRFEVDEPDYNALGLGVFQADKTLGLGLPSTLRHTT